MKKNIKKFIATTAIVTAVLTGLSVDKVSAQEKVIVGTGNGYQPFVYLDENGDLQGYDVEILKLIDEKLEDYEFSYESYDFKNILTALDSGKIDLAAHQYEINEERQAKYLYGNVGYTDYTLYITYDPALGETYESLDDLVGKKVSASAGGNVAYLLEKYNSEHDEQIDIIYSEDPAEIRVRNLTNGTVDATLWTKYDTNKNNEQFGTELVTSGEPINVSKTYFIFDKENTQLQEEVDKALQELIDEGTLKQLSIDILGDDYTQ